MPDKINGPAAAVMGTGFLFVYAGIRGYSILKAIQSLVKGSPPSTGQTTALLSATTTPTTDTSGAAYSGPTDLQSLWISNGGPSNTAGFAASVAMAESSGNANATSSNPDGGTNVGLFQLDTKGVGAGHTIAQLQNPNTNTRITVQATNGGHDWKEWANPVVDSLPNHQYNP